MGLKIDKALAERFTPAALTALENQQKRRDAEPAPRLKVLKGKKQELSLDYPDKGIGFSLLMESVGTADLDFLQSLIGQLSVVSTHDGELNELTLNFMLAVIKGIKPRDQMEAMLAAQMAATHLAVMRFQGYLADAENVYQQDSAERALNKLARTFAAQMETLKRYRTGGEQKYTVQYVSVSEGGQAIVGNVNQAPPKKIASKRARALPQPLPGAGSTRVPAGGGSKLPQ